MRFGRFFWKLFTANAALLVVVLTVALVLIGWEVNEIRDRDLTQRLVTHAAELREMVREQFDAAHRSQLDELVKRIARTQPDHRRITLILADGTVLADSEARPEEMESHAHRPEVQEALRKGTGADTRVSRTLDRSMRYVAVAVQARDGTSSSPAGIVRVAMPIRTISEMEGSVRRLIWSIGLLVLAAAVVLALGLAHLWSRPVRQITLAARSLSRGDLSTRVAVSGSDEMAVLARSLDEMRDHLAAQLQTIDRQRRTLESLLAQLHEGVIVVGSNGHLVLINPTALRMLDTPATGETPAELVGQPVEKCIPLHELQQLLLPDAPSAEPSGPDASAETIREVQVYPRQGGAALTLLARASDIVLPVFDSPRDGGGPSTSTRPGRLLVLSDMTPLTRLLQMKADFAANASHELRTPLSAIRAAIETLLQMDITSDPQAARHFVGVIDRHSRRLELMVADLLELSRLESSRAQFKETQVDLSELISDIREQHEGELTRKELNWEVDVPPGARQVTTSGHLLRIVLENLVDNAIKFTDRGGHVQIRVREHRPEDGSRQVVVTVADDGCGIAPQEQSRVFERFYQVERARSGGAVRGTGLGLSIVRHAVAAMNGSVDLQSEPGGGTQITVRIPHHAA